MKVLVLLGGSSNEREVSLRSGKAVSGALRQAGHEVLEYDPAEGYEGLRQFVGKVDCVFPILHGVGGEDGTIQEELEKLKFKYLGSDSKVSQLCFNKTELKKILDKSSILTPRWEVVDEESIVKSEIISRPYVLKPIGGGSSIDVTIVRDLHQQLYDPIVFKRYRSMLLEELIEGTEITVAVLGKTALPVVEVIPPQGQEFDYENKYNGAAQELCPPKNVSAEKQAEAQRLSEKIHIQLGVRHLSRTDFMIDASGRLFVLDINTMPGLTDQSLFPKAARRAGLNMEELAQKLSELVIAAD